MSEWNASAYHRVSNPQFTWGMRVLERVPLRGDELLIDVGCGTGRLTGELSARLPRGHVVGVDVSESMLLVARDHLRQSPASQLDADERRPHVVRADAIALPFAGIADVVFSTATFHWVLDHEALFASVYATLKPGGRFVAQCGGGPNIERLHRRAAALMHDPLFAPSFATWHEPWEFADAALTATRLAQAGFVDVRTSVEAAPVVLADAVAFHEFVTTVICRPHLAYLPDAGARYDFVERLTRLAASDDPPFELDYWRLNLDARK